MDDLVHKVLLLETNFSVSASSLEEEIGLHTARWR
jgi:hypothetical protein